MATPREDLIAVLRAIEARADKTLEQVSDIGDDNITTRFDAEPQIDTEASEALDALDEQRRTLVRLLDCLCRLAEVSTREQLHKAFGAPGDWGYHTPLGDALYRLYCEKGGA